MIDSLDRFPDLAVTVACKSLSIPVKIKQTVVCKQKYIEITYRHREREGGGERKRERHTKRERKSDRDRVRQRQIERDTKYSRWVSSVILHFNDNHQSVCFADHLNNHPADHLIV